MNINGIRFSTETDALALFTHLPAVSISLEIYSIIITHIPIYTHTHSNIHTHTLTYYFTLMLMGIYQYLMISYKPKWIYELY